MDYTIAKTLDVSVDDIISLKFTEDAIVDLKVAGIYYDTTYVDKYLSIICFSGKSKKYITSQYGSDWLSGAFVTVNNKSEFEDYFSEHEYIPEQYINDLIKERNIENIDLITKAFTKKIRVILLEREILM